MGVKKEHRASLMASARVSALPSRQNSNYARLRKSFASFRGKSNNAR